MIFNKHGLTLIELLITTSILSILVVTIGFSFMVGLKLWNAGYQREEIQTDLYLALERVSQELRHAKRIDALTASSVTFTADFGGGDTTCRVYLYDAADPEPNPPYSSSSYELRRAQGVVAYGSGAVLAKDIAVPEVPGSQPFSQSGHVITMDFKAARGGEQVFLRTKIRPRNL